MDAVQPEHKFFQRLWRDYKQYGIGGVILFLLGQLILNGFLNWVTALLLPVWGWIKTMFSGLNVTPADTLGWLITLLGIVVLFVTIINVQSDIKKDVEAWKQLTKANELETVVGKYFVNQTIVLDGKHFVDCTIENCRIRWNGGPHDVINVKFVGTQIFEFSNEITHGTIRLLKSLGYLQKEFADTLQFISKEDYEKLGVVYEHQKTE